MTPAKLEVCHAVIALRKAVAAGHQAGCDCIWSGIHGVCDCCGRFGVVGRIEATVLDTREEKARKGLRVAKDALAAEQSECDCPAKYSYRRHEKGCASGMEGKV